MRHFVDSNVFLRFLLKDHPVQSPACFAMFERAEKGLIKLLTTDIILLEIEWVLRSVAKLDKYNIVDKLQHILLFDAIEITNRNILNSALIIYQNKNIDLVDAYQICWLQNNNISSIYTYDNDFDKVKSIKRLEP